jgi:hypothetical protein
VLLALLFGYHYKFLKELQNDNPNLVVQTKLGERQHYQKEKY